jgi:hypothetical protein
MPRTEKTVQFRDREWTVLEWMPRSNGRRKVRIPTGYKCYIVVHQQDGMLYIQPINRRSGGKDPGKYALSVN